MLNEEAMNYAKDQIKCDGACPPSIFVECKNGVYMLPILEAFATTETLEKKKRLFLLGLAYSKDLHVQPQDILQICLVTEAWFASRKEDFQGLVSDQPDRKEGLLILTLSTDNKTIRQQMVMMEIIRHADSIELARDEEYADIESGLLPAFLAGVCQGSRQHSLSNIHET